MAYDRLLLHQNGFKKNGFSWSIEVNRLDGYQWWSTVLKLVIKLVHKMVP
jgi:hypothetical protein